LIKQIDIGVEALIIGVVGALQFEVLEFRLKNEYGVQLRIQSLPYRHARWIENEGLDPRKLNLPSTAVIVEDGLGRNSVLFENEWSIRMAEERNKDLKLIDIATQDFKLKNKKLF